MSDYELLKNEVIECCYCNNRINLWYINNHLKHSKRCQKYKTLYLECNPTIKEGDFLLYLNKIKKKLKYGDEEIDEES